MPAARFWIGNQTAASAAEPLGPYQFALEHEFDAFEWFADKLPTGGFAFDDLDAAARQTVRQQGERAGVLYAVHAPWQSSPLDAAGRQSILESIEFGRDIGARLVNVHIDLAQGPRALLSSLQPLLRHAADVRIQLTLENLPPTTPEQCNELFSAAQRVPRANANLGLCLDIGHANLCPATRHDYVGFLDRLAPWVPILHMHLHENFGDVDSHQVIFTGPSRQSPAGIRAVLVRLQQRGFRGALILEQWPDPPALLVEARKRLRALLAEIAVASSAEPARPPAATGPAAPQPGATASREAQACEPLDFASALAEMSAQRKSWRLRLEWIAQSLADPRFELSAAHLADLAIYLRLLGTGALACDEDGGHHRPSRHANAALRIERALLDRPAPEARWLIRKILPWLPSHAEAFGRPEPLTRIRDIAHRNDIGQDLKREIKHTLQNKLHRSAGPEDLETSARLLARVTAPGADYPDAFVQELRRFYTELQEFFNARTLEDHLSALRPKLEPRLQTLVTELLETWPEDRQHSPATLDRTLQSLARLRTALQPHFGAAGDGLAQSLRWADIKLEERAFVVLSERINQLEAESELDYPRLLDNLLPALEQFAWQGTAAAEADCCARELRLWRAGFDPAQPDHMLRLRATLERVERLTTGHAEELLALFTPRAQRLGRLLGVSDERVRQLCEADIRRSVVFQLAKLARLVLRRLRASAGLPATESVVAEAAVGRLCELERLEDLPQDAAPCVVLLRRAEGDEAIPTCVRGIVVAHDLPHLSHLGIRARQARVALATVASGAALGEAVRLVGQQVCLRVADDDVQIEPAPAEAEPTGFVVPAPVVLPPVRLTSVPTVLPLREARPATSGAKAAAARTLLELAERDAAPFRAARGCVVPFGVMDICLRRDAALWREYERLALQPGAADAGADPARLSQIRDLIRRAPIEEDLIADILRLLPPAELLMVRSSANAEDLVGFAAAGLYESVAGVTPERLAQALRQVWASLWSERAVTSRMQAGIAPSEVHMAVLIQEAISAELSFVLHTRRPGSTEPGLAYAELAVGLGETLCRLSAAGTPYRVLLELGSQTGRWTAFASYSVALSLERSAGVRAAPVDYTRVPLSTNPAARAQMATHLSRVARTLETALGSAQNVEGAWVDGLLYVLQTRPQPGR